MSLFLLAEEAEPLLPVLVLAVLVAHGDAPGLGRAGGDGGHGHGSAQGPGAHGRVVP